jgi:hypothetical protein
VKGRSFSLLFSVLCVASIAELRRPYQIAALCLLVFHVCAGAECKLLLFLLYCCSPCCCCVGGACRSPAVFHFFFSYIVSKKKEICVVSTDRYEDDKQINMRCRLIFSFLISGFAWSRGASIISILFFPFSVCNSKSLIFRIRRIVLIFVQTHLFAVLLF